MLWLIVTILAYFFLAIVSLFDRYFLVGAIPNYRIYTFYVGVLWSFLCLFLIPLGVSFPETNIIFLGIIAGLVRIFAILFLTKSIIQSEVSRVVPSIGGLLPIFSFLLFFFYLPKTETLNLFQIVAFIFFVSGSVLISLKKLSFNFFSFKYPIIAAFLFALTFFLTKLLFLKANFLSGFFLILLGGGMGAISFLIFSQNRKLIFSQEITHKLSGFFLLGQLFGGLGVFFQYYAVFLAKPGQVPLINALEGTRYIFLLFFVFLLSRWNPQILKEEISRKIIFQKVIAILLIGGGLALLTFK